MFPHWAWGFCFLGVFLCQEKLTNASRRLENEDSCENFACHPRDVNGPLPLSQGLEHVFGNLGNAKQLEGTGDGAFDNGEALRHTRNHGFQVQDG